MDGAEDLKIRRGNRRVWALSGVLALAALILGVYISASMHGSRMDAVAVQRQRMDPTILEGGLQESEAKLPAGAHPIEVHTGIYVDRIPELKVKEATWTVDCYVWFRWRGPALQPGENFQVVDGAIEQRQKVDEWTEGDQHYERYRVVAQISKFFDVRRFPLDDHLLTINLELPAYQRQNLIFLPDADSSVSSRVRVAGYQLAAAQAVEKPHAYNTALGDPRLPANYRAIHSQFRLGIPLHREGWGFFLKLFQGLIASVALALVAFFLHPTELEPRLGVGVGALFGAIASTYITSTLIPDTGIQTLADILNGLALVAIFLTNVQSVVSLYVHDLNGEATPAVSFDRMSFWGFLACSLILGVAIPLAAVL